MILIALGAALGAALVVGAAALRAEPREAVRVDAGPERRR